MKIVVFGLSVSSAWGNGHATLWRGLCFALRRRGHSVVFFERDAPYYAAHRDPLDQCGCDVRLYAEWAEVRHAAERELRDADAAIVTSYCPDARAATHTILNSRVAVRAFYDLDTPVTLQALHRGAEVSYVPENGLADFDVVLSYTGGRALRDLMSDLGARRVAPLYGSVDPSVHAPAPPTDAYACDLSYLGTYAPDRQAAFDALFVQVALACPSRAFALGGAQYPASCILPANVRHFRHVPPGEHRGFYGSSALTLNITRQAMASYGYCPSGRLFEAAACGVPILSDVWEGLDSFFEPGREILIAVDTSSALAALDLSKEARSTLAARARERALGEHTADARAQELIQILMQSTNARPVAEQPAAALAAS